MLILLQLALNHDSPVSCSQAAESTGVVSPRSARFLILNPCACFIAFTALTHGGLHNWPCSLESCGGQRWISSCNQQLGDPDTTNIITAPFYYGGFKTQLRESQVLPSQAPKTWLPLGTQPANRSFAFIIGWLGL